MAGRWMDKYSKPQIPLMDTNKAIGLAYLGELKKAVLIAPRPEFAELWGGAVWLCPDDAVKVKIKNKDSIHLALTTKEFFNVCEVISEQGESAKSVLECLRLFGGSIELPENKGVA